jgi:nucleolar protein 56
VQRRLFSGRPLDSRSLISRALKTKGNTPKYGLIYHSSFISRAAARNKGRISRTLANKCTIAARIDCFSDSPTTVFGEALRKQVEERLAFYDTGVAPTKNADAMRDALEKYGENAEEGMLESDAESESDDEEVETPQVFQLQVPSDPLEGEIQREG